MSLATRAAIALLPLGAALAPVPAFAAVASPQSTFYFGGTCTDCAGSVRGELVLSNYTLGQNVTSSNFISFHYDGSNLVPGGFTITSNFSVGGTINAPLPSAESFSVLGTSYYFSSATDGSWQVGDSNQLRDYGTAGTYAATPAATAVPEPVSLSLLAAGLAGTALLRRRRRA